ncbi:MAG: SRPBCC family protein [Homoserinimonas sp.]
MTTSVHPELDLTISRIIRAPRSAVWSAWADPASFEQWWVPAPEVCRVRDMDLRAGGSFRTEISQDGSQFAPHITGCFLAIDELERIVFTDALVDGWRPAETSFVTAVITMTDHPDGTEYIATAMHRNIADRNQHEQLGFHDGWGTVIRQLAHLVESASIPVVTSQ